MIGLLSFLAVGLLLLILLLFWSCRGSRTLSGGRELSDTWENLTLFQLQLPPRALVEQIFSSQDWDFVSRCTSPKIQRMFPRERRAIALSWLRQMRQQAARLMDFHRQAVRQNIDLSPAVEAKLATNYLFFLLVAQVLAGLIWLRGPVHTQNLVRYAVGVAEHLWATLERLLANLEPTRLGKIKSEWGRRTELV